MSLRDVGTNGRQGERISGMATDACLESECRAESERDRQREGERERKRDPSDRSLVLLLERVIRGMVATWYFRSGTNEPSKSTSSTGSLSFFAPPEGELWDKHRA